MSTGAKLELVDKPPPVDQPAIVIGECQETRLAGIDAAKIPVEGFVVKTAPNRVYLVGSSRPLPPGSDPWARWSNEGRAWAVADFMERFVGVRWYWPAEVGGRSIIRSSSLVIPRCITAINLCSASESITPQKDGRFQPKNVLRTRSRFPFLWAPFPKGSNGLI